MKDRTNTFFTSDWHIGHANVLIFDQRPFKDLDHMNSVLVNNYNATVRSEDTCFFLGDMGLCKTEVLAEVVSKLQGTKILILGNHDKGSVAMKKMGFDVVLNMASLIVAGKLVTMSHCPLQGIYRENVEGMKGASEGEHWHGEKRHNHFSVPFFGEYHLHGHTHKGPEDRVTWNQMDVGVRANKYRPVSISEVESWISVNEKNNLSDSRGNK